MIKSITFHQLTPVACSIKEKVPVPNYDPIIMLVDVIDKHKQISGNQVWPLVVDVLWLGIVAKKKVRIKDRG